MSDDTFDKYVREGVLPSPKRRGKLIRWKWAEIVSVIDGGAASVVTIAHDAFAKANMLVAVLRLLIEWGIALEYSESNPCTHVRRLETNPEGARPWPSWAFKLIDETGREDIKRAVLLARYTGQRQADVLRMNHKDIEDGGILVTQQKTGKELWVPLHPALKDALEGWSSSPYVVNRRGEPYTPERFRGVWAHVMEYTPAGRIREEGFVFHGLRASACEKLREAGCGDREIEAITGMSPDMVTRYSRFADQKRLAKAAAEKLARL
jgi:integrase